MTGREGRVVRTASRSSRTCRRRTITRTGSRSATPTVRRDDHETTVGKKRVTDGAPQFRVAVDGDGVARLSAVESRAHDRVREETGGARIADFRAIPAAVDIVAENGDVERVEPVETAIDDRIAEIETIEFETE